MYILDAAEEANIDYPYAVRAGTDSASVAKLIIGKVEHSNDSFLTDEQHNAGFFLMDISYPLEDCVI